MQTLSPFNARTQSIEFAIQELSHREAEPTMLAVREYMDEFTQTKIPTGQKGTYTDPNGDEVEYDVKAPISKFYNYVRDEKEILAESTAAYWNNYTFKHNIPNNIKVSDWLKNLRDAAFFIPANEIHDFVEWDRQFVEDIQYTCTHGEPRNDRVNGLHMKLDSSVKGVGKSFFIKGLVEGAKALGIEAQDEVSMPEGGFYNTTAESRNLVVGYSEADRSVDERTLKNIGRRELYDYTVKGLPRVQLRARAVTLGSTNGYDYCKDDRAFRTFHCLPARFTEFPESIQNSAAEVTRCNVTNYLLKKSEFWNSGILDQLSSKKKEENVENELQGESRIPESQVLTFLRSKSSSRFLIDVLTSLNDDIDLLSSISIAKLSRLYKKYNGVELTYPQKLLLSELLNGLYSKGLIKKTGHESNDMYVRYDLLKLHGIRHEDLYEDVELTIQDEIQQAQDTWNELIEAAIKWESEHPDDDPDGLEDEVEDDVTEEVEDYEPEPDESDLHGSPINSIEDLIKEEDDMAVEGIKKVNYKVDSEIKRTKRGQKVLVLNFTDKSTNEKHAKYFFIYDENGQLIINRSTESFKSVVTQIWYSRGRDPEKDDAEWSQFVERMLLVMQGKQQLHINAYLNLLLERKNPYYVQEVGLPEDYRVNQEIK